MIFLSIFLIPTLLFLILGIILLVVNGKKKATSQTVLNWPSVPGRIISATLAPQPTPNPGQPYFEPQVAYTYIVNNQPFTGNRISFVRQVLDYQSCISTLQKYPVGVVIPVFYNPQLPQDSVLELPQVKQKKSAVALAFGIISLILAFIFLLVSAIDLINYFRGHGTILLYPAATQAPNISDSQSGNSDQQSSNPQTNPPAIFATQPPASCGGWTLRLVSVESSDFQGMTYLRGAIAVENVSAPIGASISQANDLNSFFGNSILRTDQGYTYQIQAWNLQDSIQWVPPGFRYIGPDENYTDFHKIDVQAASTTTGHILDTACGQLDYDHPSANLIFPTDLPAANFLFPGQSIKIGNATLVFTEMVKEECTSYVDTVCAHITLINNDQGYEVSFAPKIMLEGADGVLHSALNGIYYLYAGPGQTTELRVGFHDSTQQNRKLIIIIDNQYWIYNVDY